MRRSAQLVSLFLLAGLVCGCAHTIPKRALELNPDTIARRQLQSRRFDTTDEKQLLTASASLLQDMGFQIDESEVPLGVIVGSKTTDAETFENVFGAILLGTLTKTRVTWDDNQKVTASLVTRPLNEKQLVLRVTFQRRVWNNNGVLSKLQSIEDPELYQDFFIKLSKAVFLEAHQI